MANVIKQPERIYENVDNYIYAYHLNKFLVLPCYPESIEDILQARFASTEVLARSAPIQSYANSGPRTVSFSFELHRDLMNQVNYGKNNLIEPENKNDDYLDVLVNCVQALSVPEYTDATKMVNPPMVAIKIGDQIFCKGIMQTANITYKVPIIQTKGGSKYAVIDLSFAVAETDAYTASFVATHGSYRGLKNTSLERTIASYAGGTQSAMTLQDVSNPQQVYTIQSGGGPRRMVQTILRD